MIDLILTRENRVIHRAALMPGDYVIGRGPDSGITADSPDVSHRHARLSLREDAVWIEDLGSSNGTEVDGEPVSGPVRIMGMSSVRIGDVLLEIRGNLSAGGGDPAWTDSSSGFPAELAARERYVIGGLVAHGGMGNILDAGQTAMHREVAMKVIRGSAGPGDLRRFIDEARITGQLEHPNIVPVHELGVNAGGQVFYTMKFVRGQTLAAVLSALSSPAQDRRKAVQRYPLPVLLTIFQKVCDAIAFAHSRGIIHRDLKPENIMLGDFGEVLVMDWGLAKRLGTALDGEVSGDGLMDPDANTLDGAVMGTPHYMAPEQARGETAAIDERTDIYALGAILHGILYLRPVVSGHDTYAVVEKVAGGVRDKLPRNWKSPHLPGRQVPISLRAVRRKALAFDQAARYQSVAELQADIAAYQAGFATGAEGAGLWTQLALLVKRHRGVSISIGLGLAVLATVVTVYTSRVVIERNRATDALVREEAEHSRAEEALKREETARGKVQTTLAEAEAAKAEADRFHGESKAMRERVVEAIRKLPDAANVYGMLHGEALRAGHIEEALANIDRALAIMPQNVEFIIARANLLQASGRFSQAIPEYRRALAIRPDPKVQASLAFTEKTRSELQSATISAAEAKQRVEEYLKSQGRVEALLKDIVDPEKPPAPDSPKPPATDPEMVYSPEAQRLHEKLGSYTSQPGWRHNRIRSLQSEKLHLDLSGLKLADFAVLRGAGVTELNLSGSDCSTLSSLAGLTLNWLAIDNTAVADLSPLAGMPLGELICHHTPIRDFTPLARCPLRILSCGHRTTGELTGVRGIAGLVELQTSGSRVTDITPLQGMGLRKLRLRSTATVDLKPLAGMPLQEVLLADSGGIRDFSPLGTLTELSLLSLPRHACGLGALKQAKKLQWVLHPRFRVNGWIPAGEFTALSDATDAAWTNLVPELQKTGAKDLRPDRLTVRELGKIDLDLRGSGIQDLRPLAKIPLHRLWLDTPDTGMDLAPLANKPELLHLSLTGAVTPELRSLMPGSKLLSIAVNKTAKDVYLLSRHPSLTHIGYDLDENLLLPSTTRDGFFAARRPDECDPREGEGQRPGIIAAARFDDFPTGPVGWQCTGDDARKDIAVWMADSSAMSGRGGGFLSAAGFSSGGSEWFRAPSAFTGNRMDALGGCLEFQVRRSGYRSDAEGPDVIIASGGLRLVRRVGIPPMKGWCPVLVPLEADGGWRVGNVNGPAATAEHLRTALSNLRELNLRGRHDDSRGTRTDLDDVILWNPAGALARRNVDTEWRHTLEKKATWAETAEITTNSRLEWLHPEDFDRLYFRKESRWAGSYDGCRGLLVVHPLSITSPAVVRLPPPGEKPEGTMLALDVRGSTSEGSLVRVLSGDREAASVKVDDLWTVIAIPLTHGDAGKPVTIEVHARGWNRERCFIHDVRFVKVRPSAPTSEQSGQMWKYTTSNPPVGWQAPEFDDSAWSDGPGGFGTQGTPGAQVRTVWNGRDIWLRRSFQADPTGITRLTLRVHHDDGGEVFLNGAMVSELKGAVRGYKDLAIPSNALVGGINHLAVHCHQDGYSQYIDAGLAMETAP